MTRSLVKNFAHLQTLSGGMILLSRSQCATRGPVAQLGARFHGMEEVIGSIPIRSTKSLRARTTNR